MENKTVVSIETVIDYIEANLDGSGRSPGLPGSLSKYGWGGWT